MHKTNCATEKGSSRRNIAGAKKRNLGGKCKRKVAREREKRCDVATKVKCAGPPGGVGAESSDLHRSSFFKHVSRVSKRKCNGMRRDMKTLGRNLLLDEEQQVLMWQETKRRTNSVFTVRS